MLSRDDIIRMAREAGLQPYYDAQEPAIERFFKLAYEAGAAAEREACARLVEQDDSMRWSGAADAIRARGQQQEPDDGNLSF